MPNSAIIIHDGGEYHQLPITHRDWGLLLGPGFKEGRVFISAFGVYENFTVAGGVPRGSSVTRAGGTLYDAAQSLLAAVERDADLLRYDYAYGFNNERTRHSGGQGIRIRGRTGILSTNPNGYCSIELFEPGTKPPRVAELIDLRVVGKVDVDGAGIVKIYRRKSEMHWLETLPPLLSFLHPRIEKELTVEHVERLR